MSNNARVSLVPKLRFQEFHNREWAGKLLGDVAALQRGFDLPSELIRLGTIPVVYSNGVQKYHAVGMASAPGLVTGRSGTIGKLHFIEGGEYWPHNTSLWVTDFKGNVPRFVYYLYDSIGIGRFSSGSGVPTLNRNDVHAFSSSVPESPAEQQKIADCLSSLDKLITAQARKVDALKIHKKGLMQQLFPREGETQPRLRFPEFRTAEEWKVGPLSQFAQINPRREMKADDVEVSFVPMNSVSENGYLASPQARNYGLVKKGFTAFRDNDVLLAKITPCFENGKAALVTELINGIGFGSTEFHVVRAHSLCLPEFMFAQIYSDQFRYLGKASMTGSGGQQRVPTAFVENYLISVPSLAEQQRIADCLTSLDNLITAATQELETLKAHKKALMQQLFPSAEAVAA